MIMFQASVEQIWAMKAVKYAETHMKVSVVLRPSHHPVSDHLQYEKNGGGRPGPLYYVDDVHVYLL